MASPYGPPGSIPGPVVYSEPAVVAPSNAVAYIAIFLAIIAIILVIIIIFVAFTGSSTFTDVVDRWTLIIGASGATSDTFTAAPNTIYQVNATGATYALTIAPFSTINTDIGTGAVGTVGTRTAQFIVDNSGSPATVTLIPPSGTTFRPTTPVGNVIGPRSTGTYYWVSPTVISRLNTTAT